MNTLSFIISLRKHELKALKSNKIPLKNINTKAY